MPSPCHLVSSLSLLANCMTLFLSPLLSINKLPLSHNFFPFSTYKYTNLSLASLHLQISLSLSLFMELVLLLPHGGGGGVRPAAVATATAKRSYVMRRCCSTVRAIMARPQEAAPAPAKKTETAAMMTTVQTETAAPSPAAATVYRDNWFDKLAIGYLSRNLQEASGSCL